MATFGIALIQPKSCGTLELRSTNPFDYPKCEANYLQLDEDQQTARRGLQFMKNLIKTPAFEARNASIVMNCIIIIMPFFKFDLASK